jgi:hypothetical protein
VLVLLPVLLVLAAEDAAVSIRAEEHRGEFDLTG